MSRVENIGLLPQSWAGGSDKLVTANEHSQLMTMEPLWVGLGGQDVSYWQHELEMKASPDTGTLMLLGQQILFLLIHISCMFDTTADCHHHSDAQADHQPIQRHHQAGAAPAVEVSAKWTRPIQYWVEQAGRSAVPTGQGTGWGLGDSPGDPCRCWAIQMCGHRCRWLQWRLCWC